MKPKTYRFQVETGEDVRVDQYLSDQLPDISRSQIKLIMQSGNVTLDGIVIEKAGTKAKIGSEIMIVVPEAEAGGLLPEKIALDILYEDAHVVVVNKPSGMVVHPGAGNPSGTLVNAILAHYPPIRDVGEAERPGIVHRLDKETSGVLILAKTNKAYKWLVKQFKSRDLSKTYLALVDGHPPTPTGRIEAPVERDLKNRTRMAVGLRGQGKNATSEYFELKRFENHSFLEVHPISGRTHQIRVHLAYIGVPVVGDTLYGRRKPSIAIDRFFLHASALAVKLPGDRIARTFEVPLPDDLQTVLDNLV